MNPFDLPSSTHPAHGAAKERQVAAYCEREVVAADRQQGIVKSSDVTPAAETPTAGLDLEELLRQGREHLAAGRVQQALHCFQSVLAADPRNADALHFRGILAYRSGDRAAAVEWLRRAVDMKPYHAEFHNNLAAVYGEMGRKDEAIMHFSIATQLNPRYLAAFVNLARACVRQGLYGPKPRPPMAAIA